MRFEFVSFFVRHDNCFGAGREFNYTWFVIYENHEVAFFENVPELFVNQVDTEQLLVKGAELL